jgi:ADP-heptose:LPS heptosyltransferase
MATLDSPRRILILRPGAIGDTLLTFPSFQALRERFPGAEITVVGNRSPLLLARDAGVIDAADAFGAAWVADLFGDEPTPELRARLAPFELGLVWMHSSEAAGDLAARLARAGVKQAFPLVSFPPAGSRRHVAAHLMDTLAPLSVSAPFADVSLSGGGGESLTLTLSQRERGQNGDRPVRNGDARGRLQPAVSALALQGEDERVALALKGEDDKEREPSEAPLVVLHPGAGARRKRWPGERFAEVGRRLVELGYALAITRGPADEEAVAALQASLGRTPARVLDGLPLPELAAALARAQLFVGNDSGVTHLAAMVGAPTLAIFGPFDPAYWRPIGRRVAVVDAGQDCPHRDDPREGCRQCDLLPSLDVESVWTAATSLLDRSAPPRAEIGNG